MVGTFQQTLNKGNKMFGLVSEKRYNNLLKSFESVESLAYEKSEILKAKINTLEDSNARLGFKVNQAVSRASILETENKELQEALKNAKTNYHDLLVEKMSIFDAAKDFTLRNK